MTVRNLTMWIAAVAWLTLVGTSCKPEPDGSGQAATSQSPSGSLKDGVRVVQVTAKRFEFEPSKIVVVQGEPVRLEVTSADVTHGIMVPDMNINRTLKPHVTETINFTPDKAGTFPFHCSVWCGPGHDQMRGEIIVIPQHTGG